MTKNKIHHLSDYQKPKFTVSSIDLEFHLNPDQTQVKSTMKIQKLDKDASLLLFGKNLKLLNIDLNEKALTSEDYQLQDGNLFIENVPESFILTTEVEINPEANKALTGLFMSNNNFFTQCEPEGFRCMTFYFDRPDYMTKFTTKIIADKKQYPVLLSNGNLLEAGEHENDKHFAIWQDPFYKPCYLFALVAGKLDCLEDEFTTRSGRKVTLRIFVEPGNKSKVEYAMTALKSAMRWDEEVYNREYDLDIFMIVAVADFNMGAMENKGLNIFNAKYILASEETATDDDYEFIAAVIAHEYFHNWSGNRVTCRDWFQLSLKEGFTVFRDQSYTEDTTSAAVKRIRDARLLRTFQFAEDAGPMSHPVQPDSYMEIENFYTHTIYEKGAEVIRMLKLLIGDEAFFKGANLYFSENDGKAVTIHEFVAAMETSSGKDLTQFKLWYKQSGTPKILIKTLYNEKDKTFHIHCQQTIPDTADMKNKKPMLIPLAMALYNKDGQQIQKEVISLQQAEQSFSYNNLDCKPVLSILNHFSAPVEIDYTYDEEELFFLMRHDQDNFSRFEANQILIKNWFKNHVKKLPAQYFECLKANLCDGIEDKSFLAELLSLPTEKYLLNCCKPIRVHEKHALYKSYELQIAEALEEEFLNAYHEFMTYQSDSQEDKARRKLKNICLHYLATTKKKEHFELAFSQYSQSKNMTDRIAAMKALLFNESHFAEDVLKEFYKRFENENLVLDKWFSVQAMVDSDSTLLRIQELMQHKDFSITNPNKVRALIGSFAMYNLGQFHRQDGKGYQLLTDIVLKMNDFNPQVAARLLEPLIHWQDFAEPNQGMMREKLQQLKAHDKLAPELFEVVTKSLPDSLSA